MNKKLKIPSLKRPIKGNKALEKRALFFSSGMAKGSMAMEGSLVLPLFLFFMMTILLSLEAVRVQSNVLEAMHQAGNRKAFEEYGIKYAGWPGAERRIKEYLDSQLYPYLCVAGGREGIVIKDLSGMGKNGEIEITAEYRLKPFISWLPVGEIKIKDRFLSHSWTGYSGGITQNDKEKEIYVYVTRTGERYHLSYHCTYLNIKVSAVSYKQMEALRNKSGGKYYACRRCRPVEGGIVYISEDGSSYHGSSDCPSLKRTVYMIPLSEAESYGACGKCAG